MRQDEIRVAVENMMDRQAGVFDPRDIDVLAKDNFELIKAMCPGSRPSRVELDEGDSDLVTVDGVSYDFSGIPHNDQINTGRRMGIEALLCPGISVDEIQARLNKKIQKEW